MTKEEVLQVVSYCQQHNVTYSSYLSQHGIPKWKFYKSKCKYIAEEEKAGRTGEFVQLVPGEPALPIDLSAYESRRGRQKKKPVVREELKLEVRCPSGKVLRLQGDLSADQLRELIKAL